MHFRYLDLGSQKAGRQCHSRLEGWPFRPSKSSRPLLLPMPARAPSFLQKLDFVATSATRAPALKQDVQLWNGLLVNVQGLLPDRRRSANAQMVRARII